MSREMRHSGIEWIGEIPKEWEIRKLKNICKRITDGSHFSPERQTDGYPYITVSNVYDGNVHLDEALRIKKEDFDLLVANGCKPENGDVLLSKDGTVGRTAVVQNVNYVVLSSLGILTPAYDCKSQYLKYLLDSDSLQRQMQLAMAGSALRRITIIKINELVGILPPLSEQQKIANYLDKICGEVDELIALQEQMIEELKAYKQSVITEAVTKGLNPDVPMKDSGIDWIGEVSEHWGIAKIKYIAKVNGRIGFRGYTSEDLVSAGEGAYTIGGKHISNCVIDLSHPDFISWDKYYESPEIMVKKGDILIAQRGSLGKAALVRDEIGEATINPSLVLLNNIKINNVFLYYYFICKATLTYIDLLNTATAVPMISQKQIENINLPTPPISEQQSIASYLDTKCAEIDALIAIKQAKIDELKDYKKSVIYEYVTGKKEVV